MTRDPKDTLLEEVYEQISRNGFDGIAKVLEILMNAAMVLERSKALGAAPYKRTEERMGYAATMRLVAALLIETHEEWINSPRYLDIETIHSLTPEEIIYRKKVA